MIQLRKPILASLVVLGLLAGTRVHAQLRAQVYVTGLSLPLLMIQDPTNPNVQFVLQQRGRIRVILNGVLQASDFLDLTGIVSTSGSERGLLGLAFHPNYATNRLFFVNYTDVASPGSTRIVRYQRNAVNPLLADPGSAMPVISIAQPFTNHNGGTLRFGPNDGYLYIGMGDGGSGNDPGNRAQTITNMLLGKMLRLDINSDAFPADPARNYAIPPNNPFVGITGDDEIWSFGLRNPWKFTFDDPTKLGSGGCIIGDVGQNTWEEFSYEPPGIGGRNYGWRVKEGYMFTGLGGGNPPFQDPIWVYPNGGSGSITGGYIYRGTLLGDFFGRYFFADYVQNRLWSAKMTYNAQGEALNINAVDVIDHTADLNTPTSGISSIDVDSNGELYYIDYFNGRILRIMPENRAWAVEVRPRWGDEIFDGGLRHFSSVDAKELLIQQTTIAETVDENEASCEVAFMTDMAAPAMLNVRVVCRVNDTTNSQGQLRLSLRNWVSGQFEAIGVRSVPLTQVTHDFNSIPTGNYRRADGRIEARLTMWQPGVLPVDPFLAFYDQIRLTPQ